MIQLHYWINYWSEMYIKCARLWKGGGGGAYSFGFTSFARGSGNPFNANLLKVSDPLRKGLQRTFFLERELIPWY